MFIIIIIITEKDTFNVQGLEVGALNLQDRKMTDEEISGGGNCRTGK